MGVGGATQYDSPVFVAQKAVDTRVKNLLRVEIYGRDHVGCQPIVIRVRRGHTTLLGLLVQATEKQKQWCWCAMQSLIFANYCPNKNSRRLDQVLGC